MKKILITIILSLFMINFVLAGIGIDNPNLPHIIEPTNSINNYYTTSGTANGSYWTTDTIQNDLSGTKNGTFNLKTSGTYGGNAFIDDNTGVYNGMSVNPSGIQFYTDDNLITSADTSGNWNFGSGVLTGDGSGLFNLPSTGSSMNYTDIAMTNKTNNFLNNNITLRGNLNLIPSSSSAEVFTVNSTRGAGWDGVGNHIFNGAYSPLNVMGGLVSEVGAGQPSGVLTVFPRGGSAIGGGFNGILLKEAAGFGGTLLQAVSSTNAVGFQINNQGFPEFPSYFYVFGGLKSATNTGGAIDTVVIRGGDSNYELLHLVETTNHLPAYPYFKITTNFSVTNMSNHGDIFKVDGQGNVSIGITRASAKLDVNGTTRIRGNLTVNENVNISKSLIVDGNSNFSDAINIKSKTTTGDYFTIKNSNNKTAFKVTTAYDPLNIVSWNINQSGWLVIGADYYTGTNMVNRIDIQSVQGTYINGPLYPSGTVLLARAGDATSTITQKYSNPLYFQTSLWNGTAGISRQHTIIAKPSTTQNGVSYLDFVVQNESGSSIDAMDIRGDNGLIRINNNLTVQESFNVTKNTILGGNLSLSGTTFNQANFTLDSNVKLLQNLTLRGAYSPLPTSACVAGSIAWNDSNIFVCNSSGRFRKGSLTF